MTGATITYRVKSYAGTRGAVQTFVQNGSAQRWANVGWQWEPITRLGEWTELTLDVDAEAADSTTFDRTAVRSFGLQITAGNTGPWTNPTVIYVDFITITRHATGGAGGGTPGEVIHVLGPFEFTTGVAPLQQSTYMPVSGSTLEHIAD